MQRIELLPEGACATKADAWVEALETSRGETLALLAQAPEEAWRAVAAPGCHTIGQLALHGAGAMLWWVEEVVNQTPLSDMRRARYCLTGQEEMCALPDSYDARLLIDLLGEAQDLTVWTFRQMEDAVFTRPDRLRPGTDKYYSPEWVLYHLLEQEAYQRGQMALIWQLLQSGHAHSRVTPC